MTVHDELYFEQLSIGDSWESPSRLIQESDILEFAELTGDRDPLHIDPQFAAETPFKKQIAHGLLGLSYMAGLSSRAPRVLTTAFLRIENWSFLEPIFISDVIRVVTRVEKLHDHGRKHGVVHWWRKILNQNDKVVQEGELVTLVARLHAKHFRIDPSQQEPSTQHEKVVDNVQVPKSNLK